MFQVKSVVVAWIVLQVVRLLKIPSRLYDFYFKL